MYVNIRRDWCDRRKCRLRVNEDCSAPYYGRNSHMRHQVFLLNATIWQFAAPPVRFLHLGRQLVYDSRRETLSAQSRRVVRRRYWGSTTAGHEKLMMSPVNYHFLGPSVTESTGRVDESTGREWRPVGALRSWHTKFNLREPEQIMGKHSTHVFCFLAVLLL